MVSYQLVLGLPSLHLLCDGSQAGCHIHLAVTWMQGSKLWSSRLNASLLLTEPSPSPTNSLDDHLKQQHLLRHDIWNRNASVSQDYPSQRAQAVRQHVSTKERRVGQRHSLQGVQGNDIYLRQKQFTC